MSFAKDTIKLGTARRIFKTSDIAAHDKRGDRILDNDTETKAASYSAFHPRSSLRLTDTGLTDLCERLWTAANNDD
jgi:hypothetical protein